MGVIIRTPNFQLCEELKARKNLKFVEVKIMKERLLKALFVSITVALGITLVTILQNEDFSFVKSGLYAIVAFIVDFVFSNIFEKKKR